MTFPPANSRRKTPHVNPILKNPDTAHRAIEHFADGEKVKAKLHELTVLHPGRPLGIIAISVGVAAVPIGAWHICEELLQSAGAALHRAKREGRAE